MVRMIDPVKMHEHSNASAGYHPYAMFRLHNRGLLIPFHPLLQATVETVHPMRRCTVVRLILRTFDPHIYNEPDHLNGGGEEVRSMLVCGGGGGGHGCEEEGGARQVQRTPARQHGSTSARQHVSTSAHQQLQVGQYYLSEEDSTSAKRRTMKRALLPCTLFVNARGCTCAPFTAAVVDWSSN